MLTSRAKAFLGGRDALMGNWKRLYLYFLEVSRGASVLTSGAKASWAAWMLTVRKWVLPIQNLFLPGTVKAVGYL